jgi:hypothetical protein
LSGREGPTNIVILSAYRPYFNTHRNYVESRMALLILGALKWERFEVSMELQREIIESLSQSQAV